MNTGVINDVTKLAENFRRRAELLTGPNAKEHSFIWRCAAEDLEAVIADHVDRFERRNKKRLERQRSGQTRKKSA